MELNQFVGKKNKIETIVKESETAMAVGSGSIAVFSTPNMIGLMENAALNLTQPLLAEGYTTVGTSINIVHLAATPVGVKVTAEAELVQVDDKKLEFKVTVWDEKEKIGEGIHQRFIVNATRFMEKAQNKCTKK